MGTRGIVGVVVDGTEKLAYNHSDSYPDGVGIDVLQWLHVATDSVPALRKAAQRLKTVTDDVPPTDEEVALLQKHADTSVSTGELTEWYVLLRGTQGSLHDALEIGYMLDAGDFPLDSLFCEWGYVVDLDAERFEVYQGFSKEPHTAGRFADRQRMVRKTDDVIGSYYPIRLVQSWPLSDLPTTDEWNAVPWYGENDDE